MNNPLISVIVPVYNVEKFIEECIDSILEQTYTNIEIILIDDGCTDASPQIIEKKSNRDSRIKVIHQTNQGVSSARNRGIEIAKGEYICFVDSDDILKPDYVEYLYRLAKEADSDISLTTHMFSSYGDKQVKEEIVKKISGEQAAINILHYFIPIGCYCKLFKRDVIGTEVRFDPQIFIGEGFNFNIESFLRANTVAVGNKKIYKYRRDNDQSAMTVFRADKCRMALDAIDIIHGKLPNNELFEEAYKYAKWHTASNMYDWIVMAKSQTKYPSLYNECYYWVKKYSKHALFAKSPKSDKIRAFLQMIHPSIVPGILKIRKQIFLSK